MKPSAIQSKDAVAQAAVWYALNRDQCPHPIIPALREMFGLRAKEAVDALRAASEIGGLLD